MSSHDISCLLQTDQCLETAFPLGSQQHGHNTSPRIPDTHSVMDAFTGGVLIKYHDLEYMQAKRLFRWNTVSSENLYHIEMEECRKG